MTGRDIVLDIERLVELKLEHELDPDNSSVRDQLELTRRRLTDTFLAMDPRKGVYVASPEEQERMSQ